MRRDVFQAIADPTRREIINLVADKPLNLNTVAQQFSISRPAISKHIKILVECGLIEINQLGRERFCKARTEQLAQVSDWIENFRHLWEARLDSFEEYLTQIQNKGNDDGKQRNE
ncbi:MAG: ArsR family transcriptional regulator [Calditrichaeota bacterium]|nr:MAG: ArsR family transcriptional regulator [Calditrichota bacterium]MBL1207338.1 ArsR family transcriptional regulator [Calditrichota bacterium]NOG47171.1 winged helix-turn-helix transcriptional regulator [Calditrichota bacterium]